MNVETIPSAPSLTASATNYYFSNAGSDSNDCLSTGTSCQTLAKIATWKWVAGSTINLNRGDTFVGTAYLFGGGTAGGTPPSFTGATFANMTAYGTGANPTINAGGANTCIRFDRNATRDAWKISNIDLKGARVAGIDSEGDHTTHANGLWIDGVNITGITGGGVWSASSGFPSNMPNPGYFGVMPAGLISVFTDNIYWHTATTDHTDMPAYIEAGTNVLLDGLTATNTSREGVYFGGSTVAGTGFAQNMVSGTVTNSHITGVGATGMFWGTTGIQFFACTGCTISNTEIDHVVRGNGSPDGECFDDEGGQTGFTVDTVNAHDCDGSCYLHEVASGETWGQSSGTVFKNTTCTNNVLNPDTGTTIGAGIWIRDAGGTGDHIQLTSNTINKSGKTYGLYQIPQHGTTSDTPSAVWTLSGNTINP